MSNTTQTHTTPAPDADRQDQRGSAPAESSRSATATAPSRGKSGAPGAVDSLPPFKVILHNDDVNDMAHVVRALRDAAHLNAAEARTIMFEAHRSGSALVMVSHRERAELYRDRLRSKNLCATIEPERR